MTPLPSRAPARGAARGPARRLRGEGLHHGLPNAVRPQEVAGILELGFDNVLPGHGEVVMGGAAERIRPVIAAEVASAGWPR